MRVDCTVANLTLMALGSSAPEILLAVIETTTNNFYSGELGPSTIVGSAAFNLMGILAVCVMVIPDGESRSIEQYGVFLTTASFSVLAYLWLGYILLVSSPSVVTLAEGLTTLALFPLLVWLAYLMDIGWLGGRAARGSVIGVDGGALSEEELARLVREVKARHPNEQISKEVLAEAVALEAGRRQPKSRMYWRINGTRQMVGGRRVIQPEARRLDEEAGAALGAPSAAPGARPKPAPPGMAFVGFGNGGKYAVSEGDGHVTLTVQRSGNLDCRVTVTYKTHDGTAKAGQDYKVRPPPARARARPRPALGSTLRRCGPRDARSPGWRVRRPRATSNPRSISPFQPPSGARGSGARPLAARSNSSRGRRRRKSRCPSSTTTSPSPTSTST